MNAGQYTEGTPRHKKDQSDLAVLVVQILRCGLDNQRHNKHGRTNADVNGPSHLKRKENQMKFVFDLSAETFRLEKLKFRHILTYFDNLTPKN